VINAAFKTPVETRLGICN